jgi:hypothetical protein
LFSEGKGGVDWQRCACHFGAMSHGVCKLTGTHGKFVKCHIIPAALTPPEVKGDPLHQGGQGRSVRRMISWYDKALVTRAGEEILRDLDTWAIRELRQQKLIWSSWGADSELNTRDYVRLPVDGIGWGFREIQVSDAARLRQFFLSLLWRAAASNMYEFAEVAVEEPVLAQLRDMILAGSADPPYLFPIQLNQLSTRGVPHNLTPISRMVADPDPNGGDTPPYPIFRFYFDGLCVKFDRRSLNQQFVDQHKRVLVGASDRLAISTMTFEKSWQLRNFVQLQIEGLRAEGILVGKSESDLQAIWNYGCELVLGRKLRGD